MKVIRNQSQGFPTSKLYGIVVGITNRTNIIESNQKSKHVDWLLSIEPYSFDSYAFLHIGII